MPVDQLVLRTPLTSQLADPTNASTFKETFNTNVQKTCNQIKTDTLGWNPVASNDRARCMHRGERNMCCSQRAASRRENQSVAFQIPNLT